MGHDSNPSSVLIRSPWADTPFGISTLSDLLRVPMHLDWHHGWPQSIVGGVYVIWMYGYAASLVVHVGQAVDIADRFGDHLRHHRATFPYPGFRPSLYGTWAEVRYDLRDGVERYVGDRLRPDGVYRNVQPRPVVLPQLRTDR